MLKQYRQEAAEMIYSSTDLRNWNEVLQSPHLWLIKADNTVKKEAVKEAGRKKKKAGGMEEEREWQEKLQAAWFLKRCFSCCLHKQ